MLHMSDSGDGTMRDICQDLERSTTLSSKDFSRLSQFIYNQCGIKMPATKKIMLEARLQKRVRNLGMKSFREYCDYLFSPEGVESEIIQMIDLVTTNKTDFFREPDHFEYLTHQVLPGWVQNNGGDSGKRLLVWSAGCSSGEEPYTLAMVLSEFAQRSPGFTFRILGTDISTRMLEKARTAIYDEEHADAIPPILKRKYLLRSKDKSKGLIRVIPELREKVDFRRLNFMDEDFSMMEQPDIIFCRNVIIYFDRQNQEKLLNRFYTLMSPGGYIFMGHSETLNGLTVPFTTVYPTVYRKLT